MKRVKRAVGLNQNAARAACGLAVSALALMMSPAALGQSALGNGQGLQRNLHRFNQSLPSRDALASTRFQNSVAYGNAPNGQSFQGNLGYRNPSDFQGKLGSNDLFNFTRDSAFSGLAGQGIRGSQLNDYQGALSRGERGLSASLGGVFDVQRQGTNYNRGNSITSTARNSTGRRDQFGAPSLGNLRLSNGASSYDPGTDIGDSLKSTLRSSLESSLSSSLGKQRGGFSSGRGQGASLGLGGTSSLGADSLISDSLNPLRSSVLERSSTLSDRSLGLSGASSAALRDRNPGAAPSSRPGQAPSNRVGGPAGTGLGPVSAVPRQKTSFDDLQDRLNKLDASQSVLNVAPVDKLPDVLPGTALPSDKTPGSNSETGNPLDPNSKAGGGAGRSVPMTWQSRMDELRGQLSGDPAKAGKVSLIGKPNRTRGFVDRRGDAAKGAAAEGTKDLSAAVDKTNGKAGEKPSDDVAVRSRSGITPGNAIEVPERFKDEKVKDGSEVGGLRGKIDPRTLQLIRDAGTKVDTLRPAVEPGPAGKNYFAEHMQAGERLLGESMYFDAEDRFAKAISANPNDVTGHVGRVHAQIGSGLFRSAGFGLRKILAAYPEATGQRYAAGLLPSKARIEQLTARMRENLSADTTADGPTRRDSALLLAYIGFQTTDRKTAEEGITAMGKTIGADPDAKPGEDERLIELLRGVWLDDSFYKVGEKAAEK